MTADELDRLRRYRSALRPLVGCARALLDAVEEVLLDAALAGDPAAAAWELVRDDRRRGLDRAAALLARVDALIAGAVPGPPERPRPRRRRPPGGNRFRT